MKIALIGSAPSSVQLAPYKDSSYAGYLANRPQLERSQAPFLQEEWDIWGCSPGVYGIAGRVNRWFELHRWEPGQTWFSPEYCDFLRAFKGTVYTGEKIDEISGSVRLPREDIVAEFSPFFLTSSLSFMCAMAIMEIEAERELRRREGEPEEQDVIGFWGVDMAATEEYGYQRAGCQFFILEAQKRGITVVFPPESDLMRPMPMYGISEWSHVHIKALARMRELDAQKANAEATLRSANDAMQFFRGAAENQKYVMNTWLLNEHTPSVPINDQGQQLVRQEPFPPLFTTDGGISVT